MPPKPRLRGVSHRYAAIFAVLAGVLLIWYASGVREKVSVCIYSATLAAMFAASAFYHLRDWRPSVEPWLRRLDHSAIFFFIAGTYTPFCLLALYNDSGILLLVLVWSFALLGVLRALLWVNAPSAVSASIYVVQGWMIVPYLPRLAGAVGPVGFTLIAAGGLVYTLGAVVFSLRRPDPVPAVFGYHEVFHLLVIAGCALQFSAVTCMVVG